MKLKLESYSHWSKLWACCLSWDQKKKKLENVLKKNHIIK